MAGRIPSDFIDDLVARTDIVDVIDSRVKLKKAGRNYQACCPFHNEKTPSFSVSQEKQFFYCFGCGAKGNVIGFLMDYDRLEFVEAVEELAALNGVEVPRDKSVNPQRQQIAKQQRQSDYEVMSAIAKFFQQQLKSHDNRTSVVEYLKTRGLSGEIAKQWEIGYAPPEWDSVLSEFGKDSNAIEQLLSLKVVNQNDNGKRYDFFRDRLMFPIRDRRGKVVAFGGRVIGDQQGPKYLNSPETRIFHKSNELYGFFQARNAQRDIPHLLVVEGYMDVVALSQFGIDYSVAALGTATTPEHIQMMFRATTKIICCYDGDRAGRQAAWRALENALPFLRDGVSMHFLFLPDGEDPDTIVRKEGKSGFESRLKDAMPLSQFIFNNLLERHQTQSIEGKAAFKAEAVPLIDKIEGENQREMLMKRVSELCGDAHAFTKTADIRKNQQYSKPKSTEYKQFDIKLTPMRHMMRLLIDTPSLPSRNSHVRLHALENANIAGVEMLLELNAFCLQHPDSTTGRLLESFREHPNARHLHKLLETEIQSGLDVDLEYRACFKTLLKQYFDTRLDELQQIMVSSGLTAEQEQELTLLLSQKNER